MKKPDAMRSQSQMCVLRVDNIHCDGCKGKIRKLLKKIEGVNAISIDVEQGKVTVTGNVDPAVLIKKLEKLGKHAEIWRSQRGANYSKGVQFDLVNNQFKSLQMGNGDKRFQMKDGKDRQIGYESVKGGRDLKVPLKVKDQRTVRFDLSKKDHVFDDFSGDDFDDEDDNYDSEDEEFDEEDEFGYGGHQRQHSQKKVMPIKGKNGNVSKKLKKGGVKAKKDGGLMSMIGKVIGGKKKGKDGNAIKKGGRGGGGSGSGGRNKGCGGEGKIGNKAGGGGGGGVKKGGGGKNGMYSDFEITTRNHGGGGGRGGGGGGGGHYQVPVTRGPPASIPPMVNMNGGNGYYQGGNGVGPMMAANPYQQQQQQQYMAMMMMNQQRMMNGGGGGGVDMHHMAMYGRPPPGYGYMAPPQPAYHHDPYTHMFSDENTGSCSIM